jgi:predicted metal-dependent peptidase
MKGYKDTLEHRIKPAVIEKIPFIASLLRKARIFQTSDINAPAQVDIRGWIYVDPEKMRRMEVPEQVFTLAHEVMHVVNMHPKRTRNKEDRDKWNLATDCVVNRLLDTVFKASKYDIMPYTIANTDGIDYTEEEISKMSDEEIYQILLEDYDPEEKMSDNGSDMDQRVPADKLPDVLMKNPMYSPGEGDGEEDSEESIGGDLSDEKLEGDMIQEGEEFNDAEDEEKKSEWKKSLVKASQLQEKSTGNMPSGLKRYVDELIKPDINVKSLIKQQIENGLGNLRINNWRRTSRKHPDFPGTRMLTTPTVWVLMDTSGSIKKKELSLFLGAVYEFTSRADVKIIPWDADSYDVLESSSKSQVMSNIADSLEGGGGTVILPCLEKVLDDMENRDVVCVLTDGGIQDIGRGKTKDYLRMINQKSSASFICTTQKEIDADGWKVLKIMGR